MGFGTGILNYPLWEIESAGNNSYKERLSLSATQFRTSVSAGQFFLSLDANICFFESNAICEHVDLDRRKKSDACTSHFAHGYCC